MFARHITLQLKPSLAREFPVAFENEILPLVKDRKGFLDEILLYSPESFEIVAIGLWERKENAENYHREVYPKVEKILEKYVDGIPKMRTYEAQYSTFHKLANVVTV
jgi:hypothetical protein